MPNRLNPIPRSSSSREAVAAEEAPARHRPHLVVELRPADPPAGPAEADELHGLGVGRSSAWARGSIDALSSLRAAQHEPRRDLGPAVPASSGGPTAVPGRDLGAPVRRRAPSPALATPASYAVRAGRAEGPCPPTFPPTCPQEQAFGGRAAGRPPDPWTGPRRGLLTRPAPAVRVRAHGRADDPQAGRVGRGASGSRRRARVPRTGRRPGAGSRRGRPTRRATRRPPTRRSRRSSPPCSPGTSGSRAPGRGPASAPPGRRRRTWRASR